MDDEDSNEVGDDTDAENDDAKGDEVDLLMY